MSNEKHQILETISAISRLITLAFKPIGTKIAIRCHKLVLCEPTLKGAFINTGLSQSIDRYWNGDSRKDISVLNHVIRNFIDWYILPNKDNEKIYLGMIQIAKYLCVGLIRLQYTYRSDKGNVAFALQYYINILVAIIEERFYPGMLYNPNSKDNNSILDANFENKEDPMIYSTIFDVNKFKNIWNDEELTTLCDQFGKCFKEYNISESEQNEQKDISNLQTYCGYTNFTLPIPRNKYEPLVDGHLTGLSKMLDRMDKKFIGMLNQSVKGGRRK